MTRFDGFGDGSSQSLTVPAGFLTDLLPVISDLDALKLLFCFFCLLPARTDQARFVFLDDLEEDEVVKASFPGGQGAIIQLLEKACHDKVLLAAAYEDRPLYFLNTAQAAAAIKAIQKGVWSPTEFGRIPNGLEPRPNIFTLYEKNIGPLTPILAQTLEDAEKEYPAEWLEDAVKIAVKKNVRNWQYIEAILRSWKEKGRSEKDQRNHQEDARKYIEGDLADYIKH
jgi:DnaD/phage-associated family protein